MSDNYEDIIVNKFNEESAKKFRKEERKASKKLRKVTKVKEKDDNERLMEEVRKFIKQMRLMGYTHDKIKYDLKDVGFDPDFIEEGFRTLGYKPQKASLMKAIFKSREGKTKLVKHDKKKEKPIIVEKKIEAKHDEPREVEIKTEGKKEIAIKEQNTWIPEGDSQKIIEEFN